MSNHCDESGTGYIQSMKAFARRHGLNDYASPSVSSLNIPVEIDSNTAKHTYEILKAQIGEFENSLDDSHEVALQLASFGYSVTMSVEEIGYANPSALFFYGLINNQRATLIQHISQLNFLLMSVEKENPNNPPRRIGFTDETD